MSPSTGGSGSSGSSGGGSGSSGSGSGSSGGSGSSSSGSDPCAALGFSRGFWGDGNGVIEGAYNAGNGWYCY
ncbi:hypothetical protein [Pseudoclavibacter soli]|uniref:hypothetical protein n=1 Tax=Pseudoclavibacter soli TaxID=452623 RepID=UPI000429A97F|nr:hypothetical protein [Pseudoclavibacter soli]